MSSAKSKIEVKKKLAWSSVPDALLTNSGLSWRGRVILGWMLGRPEGWELYVSHIQKVFGLSQEQWKATRKELEATGFFKQRRERDEKTGAFIWHNVVTDAPLYQKP